jgi:AraC-like DNA-binding protein
MPIYTWADLKPESWPKIGRDCKYKVKMLAKSLGWSKRKLEREFQEHLSTTPHAFLRKLQIEAAMEMIIANPEIPTKVIASDLFFRTSAYFCAEFKKHTGLRPQEFAERVKGERGNARGYQVSNFKFQVSI